MHNALTDEWAFLCETVASDGFDDLSHADKVWFSVRILIDSTENGGLISYFYNSGADNYYFCLQALDELDSQDVKLKVAAMGRLFGDLVSTDLEDRNVILNSWSDAVQAQAEKIDDELSSSMLDELNIKLQRYLELNDRLKR